jgi:hypothetical protein
MKGDQQARARAGAQCRRSHSLEPAAGPNAREEYVGVPLAYGAVDSAVHSMSEHPSISGVTYADARSSLVELSLVHALRHEVLDPGAPQMDAVALLVRALGAPANCRARSLRAIRSWKCLRGRAQTVDAPGLRA